MLCVFQTSNYLSSQAVSNQVLSTYVSLTTVFGMGTGGTPQLSSLDMKFEDVPSKLPQKKVCAFKY